MPHVPTIHSMAIQVAPPSRPIVFFDGECGLCDRFVQFVLDRDHEGRIDFAPLQGETYAAYRTPQTGVDLSTMVLADRDGLHTRSTAALRVLRLLGAPWGIVGAVGLVVPRFLRDSLYQLVARSRYRLFGRVVACRLPTAAERARLLP